MAKTYSMDLRTRVMNNIHNGRSERKTAAKFRISRQWIQQLKRQEKQTGSFEARPLKGVAGAKRKLKPFQEQLKKCVAVFFIYRLIVLILIR
jgi:transposase